ncbi:hypothetical protein NPIL_59331, partial [Nephila pilipes]
VPYTFYVDIVLLSRSAGRPDSDGRPARELSWRHFFPDANRLNQFSLMRSIINV